MGRESEAHPAFNIIPSLDFDRFSTRFHSQLGNEKNQQVANCYLSMTSKIYQ
jgi:hypothetical protein